MTAKIDEEVMVIRIVHEALWRLAYSEKAMVRVLRYIADRLGFDLVKK